MKLVNLSMAAAAVCLLATSAHALKTEDRVLKGNMQVEYLKTPGAAGSIAEMFTEGEWYGRLRSNMFWWDWENQNDGKTADNNMFGVGANFVYKTAFFHGFGATAGFYGAVPWHGENKDGFSPTANYGKAGKDTYHTRADGSEGAMGVVAQAYGEFKAGKTDAKIGRQLIDSVMLASNDTKMIPNAFEAAVIENKDLPATTLRAGYIMSQKLRDHQNFHSIIAFEKYNENDDSGAHKGLTPANIIARGKGDVNPEMVLVTASNQSIPNLKLNAEYVGVDGFVDTVIAEANYKIKLGDAWTLTPGIRYLHQMDDGAGRIGGASLSGKLATLSGAAGGYSDASNADGNIIMARLVAQSGPLELQAGYAKVANDADIIAPWRGFPTGGYTRSMAQVDWIANTKNWAIKAAYDFGKAGVVSGLKVAADYENMNFDEAKAATSGFTDRDILHVDVWKTFQSIPNTEFKFRFATVDADPAVAGNTDYNSYDEYRFEINYLF